MPDSRKDREALDEQSVLFSHFIEPTLSGTGFIPNIQFFPVIKHGFRSNKIFTVCVKSNDVYTVIDR